LSLTTVLRVLELLLSSTNFISESTSRTLSGTHRTFSSSFLEALSRIDFSVFVEERLRLQEMIVLNKGNIVFALVRLGRNLADALQFPILLVIKGVRSGCTH
jgi:hypothetical protein